jgi:hypothetical protein
MTPFWRSGGRAHPGTYAPTVTVAWTVLMAARAGGRSANRAYRVSLDSLPARAYFRARFQECSVQQVG